MLALLIDHDFREPIVVGLAARVPGLDFVRVRDVGLRQMPDPEILEWAAAQRRVVLTHDLNTMVGFAYERVARREPMPGVVAVAQALAIGRAIEDLDLLAACGAPEDFEDRVVFLPL